MAIWCKEYVFDIYFLWMERASVSFTTKTAYTSRNVPNRVREIIPTFLFQIYYNFYCIWVITYAIHLLLLLNQNIRPSGNIQCWIWQMAKRHNLVIFQCSITLLFTDGLFFFFNSACYLIKWYTTFFLLWDIYRNMHS